MSIFSSIAFLLPADARVLQGLQILQCDRAALEQIGDELARGAAEQIEQVPNQAAAIFAPIDRWLEELRVADLLDLAHGAFLLEPVHERLHRRVRNLLVFRKALED